MDNKMLNTLPVLLVIIGGLNWLTVGLFDLNLVNMLLGSVDWLERLIYIVVGISAVYMLITFKKFCPS